MAVHDLKFVDGGAILVQSSGTVPELRFVDGGAYVVHEWVDAPVGGIIPLIQHHRQQQGTT